MAIPKLPEPSECETLAYRNIYTIKTSQDLFDDLSELADAPTLQAWENATSQIDHSSSPTERNFQYGDNTKTLVVFDQLNWNSSRFSNGTFGVWYGAKDQQTSIMETLYWSYKHAKEDIARSTHPVIIDRKMFEADCTCAQTIDLSKDSSLKNKLTSEDYSFCQSLGTHAIEKKIGMYITPSARNPDGLCIPVFDPNVIRKDRMLYFCHFTFFPDGKTQITTDQDRYFEIPGAWNT